ncbi:MAG: AMIN domain-containing protein, partial [Sutterella wadsworthensis]|nr:AMIN domain-containing protein [Sutterella wadsworthensis]
MEFDRRRLISAAGGTLLLSLAPWQIASGAKLVNVRMWPAEEYTRVTIETDEPLKFKHFFVRSASPLRLVIDIEGLALTERIKRLIAPY